MNCVASTSTRAVIIVINKSLLPYSYCAYWRYIIDAAYVYECIYETLIYLCVDANPGIQLDLHGTPYHGLPLLQRFIKLARYYKLNVLTFNIGPSLWLSPAMKSTAMMNQSWKAHAPLRSIP